MRVGLGGAVVAAVEETYVLVKRTLQGLGQIISGQRSAQELGGPIMIAQLSGERAAAEGWLPLLELVVVISATLGLINLFPIPVLDGGHLAFYADRKSTRLNSSHVVISYAVFCLKKKTQM